MAGPISFGLKLDSWFANNMKANLERQCAALLNDANEEGVKVMKSHAPVKTGALRDDLQVLKEATPNDLEVDAGSTSAVPYTFFQEVGFNGKPGKYFIRMGHQASIAYVKANVKRIRL